MDGQEIRELSMIGLNSVTNQDTVVQIPPGTNNYHRPPCSVHPKISAA
jgi:hypothetical protein